MLTITRWVFDGLRLVSLAQAACDSRGCSAADHMAIVQQDRVATFLFKKTPFTPADVGAAARDLSRSRLYRPVRARADRHAATTTRSSCSRRIGRRSTTAIITMWRPTTDNRPFFFHTTKIEDQFQTAFGRSMLFGNGLSALMTLMAISVTFVALFVVGPLAAVGQRAARQPLAAMARVLRHARRGLHADRSGAAAALRAAARPSGLLADGDAVLGAARHGHRQPHQPADQRRRARSHAFSSSCSASSASPSSASSRCRRSSVAAISASHAARIALAVRLIAPAGVLMGMPLPAGIRLMTASHSALVPWAWGMNGALSVIGATLAVFIAMNWGFSVTLMTGAAVYLTAAVLLHDFCR